MKIQLLNNLLTESFLSVRFLFAPTVLPIDTTGKIVSDQLATSQYFTSLVLIEETNEFCVFEYDQSILNSLMAYRSRNGNMSTFSVLINRKDGKMNLTMGAKHLSISEEMKGRMVSVQHIAKKLYEHYTSKQNYIVYEMNNGVK